MKTYIADTVGLWGTPINKFRVFKALDESWHIIWPGRIWAERRTTNGVDAHRIVIEEISRLRS